MIGNAAAELGPSRFKWWQDWRGECAAIVASGPSMKQVDVGQLRDRIHVIAIKENVNVCPWADVVYGCDAAWWIWRKGLPEFRGVKIAHGVQATTRFPDLAKVKIEHVDRLLTDDPAVIGSGGNSGFQALNLAVQFGATSIILVGFDMHAKGGQHWYGRNIGPGMNNPQESNFQRWLKAFNTIAPECRQRKIDVINASPHSAINCFPHKRLEQVLGEWGL